MFSLVLLVRDQDTLVDSVMDSSSFLSAVRLATCLVPFRGTSAGRFFMILADNLPERSQEPHMMVDEVLDFFSDSLPKDAASLSMHLALCTDDYETWALPGLEQKKLHVASALEAHGQKLWENLLGWLHSVGDGIVLDAEMVLCPISSIQLEQER